MSSDVELAKRIRSARTAANLKAVQVARDLGVTPQAVSAWEREGRGQSPSPDNMQSMADLFGVSLTWLRHGNPEGSATEDFSDFPAPRSPADIAKSPSHRRLYPRPINVQDFYLQAIASTAILIESAKPNHQPALDAYHARALVHLSTFIALAERWSSHSGRSMTEASKRMQDLGLIASYMLELLQSTSVEWTETESREWYSDLPISLALDPVRLQTSLGVEPISRRLKYFNTAEVLSDRPNTVRWIDDRGNTMLEIACAATEERETVAD